MAMLYLAKVQKNDAADSTLLMLLACQNNEGSWSLISPLSTEGETFVIDSHIDCPMEGFVLVKKNDDGEIESLQNATDWVLTVIEQYVTKGITPEILITEAEQAEEWRQSLTLKSQDIVRRSLEVETRRDQIQELERGLEEKRTKLDVKEEEIHAFQQSLEQSHSKLEDQQAVLIAERQKLDRERHILNQQQQEWQRKQERLQKEIDRVETLKQQIEIQAQDHQNILEMK
ncbi:MAG: hypothetical protein AAGD25_34655 [Cyanobacteria bacterium P01_F01_bin.150]